MACGLFLMRRSIMRLVLALGMAVALPAGAACVAPAGQPRLRLVELYTSEGCSSCPPADAWLRRANPAAVVGLEFHVDYWDSLGWTDRFASARYTQRQQQQAQRDGASGVYTPQVVLDGRSWSGWYRGGDVPPPIIAAAELRVEPGAGKPLRLRVEAAMADPAAAAEFRSYVALTEDELTSAVRAGENRGALLRHGPVVRAWAGPLPLTGADVELPVADGIDRRHAKVIAFVQRPADGAIAQVVSCALPMP